MKKNIILFKEKKDFNDINQLLQEYNNEKSIVLAFGNNHSLIESLQNSFSNANIIGSSTAGEIFNDQLHDDSLSVLFCKLEKTNTHIEKSLFEKYEDSYQVGLDLFNKLNAKENLSGVIVLSEGLLINGAKLTEGFAKNNVKNIPIAGGLAADSLQFKSTFLFDNTKILNQAVIAIGFYGEDFKMIMNSKTGMKSFGTEKKVTKSDKNILYQIDHKPALDVYIQYLGEKAKELPASGLLFPLEISENFKTKDKLLRTPINVDFENRSLIFTGEIPENCNIRIVSAQKEAMINAIEDLSEQNFEMIPIDILKDNNFFSLLVSCAARRVVLQNETEDEIIAAANFLQEKHIKNENNVFGFYAYGEIVTTDQQCTLANQTMSQIIFYEK